MTPDGMERTPEHVCLNCGSKLNARTAVNHSDKASGGDISICFYCGHIMAYDADLTLRELTDEEMVKIAGDPCILAIQKARGIVLAKKPRQ